MYRVMTKRQGQVTVLEARTRKDALRIVDRIEQQAPEILIEDEARRCYAPAEFRQHCEEARS